MRVPRIVNRGRVVPTSSKSISDSERASWSSASIVSTIDTQSPEPRVTEDVTQQISNTTAATSTINKKLIISLIIVVGFVLTVGLILAIVLPLTLNRSSTVTSIPTLSTVASWNNTIIK